MERRGRIRAVVKGAALACLALAACAWAHETGASDVGPREWAYISAAIVAGIGSLAAGIAVAFVGSAAMGAMSEKPELAGRAIVYVGLAEGVWVCGLIVAILILGKV